MGLLFSLEWLGMLVGAQPRAQLVEVRRIWDQGPHNAFTDLVRFQGRWFCVFREGQAHVSPDGALRVISSSDGQRWESAALLTLPPFDLRDPKVCLTPEGRLMLVGAAALHQPRFRQTLVWFSEDGGTWTEPYPIGHPNFWLWRVTWHRGVAYSVGYRILEPYFVRLYSSPNGRHFDPLAERIFEEGFPNEASLLFLEDDTCLCLLRRDGKAPTAQLGRARPPYTHWTWKDLGVRLGGPHWVLLPDGRPVVAGRRYDGEVRTSLMELDAEAGSLQEFLILPSGGDTSYPGLVWHEGMLWVSYYSSHEGKANIYLAQVRLP